MSKEIWDVAVCYTDGSHIENPYPGTGTGIHVYCYKDLNKKFFEDGVWIEGIPELVTANGYDLMPTAAGMKGRKPLSSEQGAKSFKWYECSAPIYPATSQVAELNAFLELFSAHIPFIAKEYHIHTDSAYLKNGVEKWLKGWIKGGWVKSNGTTVLNQDIWKKISSVITTIKEEGIKFTIHKIKGHSGRFGNEEADRLAGRASSWSAIGFKDDAETLVPTWDTVPYITVDESESLGKKLKDAKLLPDYATSKLYYVLSDEESPQIDVGDERYHYILSGDHAKNKDDLALICKFIPDTMFTCTLTPEPLQVIYDIAKDHADLAWGDTGMMHRYSALSVLSGVHIARKNFVQDYVKGMRAKDMVLMENNNLLMYGKTYISQLMRPPLLSYRAVDVRDELASYVKGAMLGDAKFTVNDITPILFDEKGKPTDIYKNVDRALSVVVKQPCSDRSVNITLSQGIDIPNRTILNRIVKGGKLQVITWRFCERIFQYATVLVHPEYNILWMGYYSAKRILGDKEL